MVLDAFLYLHSLPCSASRCLVRMFPLLPPLIISSGVSSCIGNTTLGDIISLHLPPSLICRPSTPPLHPFFLARSHSIILSSPSRLVTLANFYNLIGPVVRSLHNPPSSSALLFSTIQSLPFNVPAAMRHSHRSPPHQRHWLQHSFHQWKTGLQS